MDDTALREVFALYGVTVRRFLPPQKGYRNTSYPALLADNRQVNFILYKNEPGMPQRIKRIHAVSLFLAAHYFPVRHPLTGQILQLQTAKTTRFGALYGYLPGATIPWEGYTKNHIKLVGMAMGKMHARLREFEPPGNSAAREYMQLVDRMRTYFEDENVARALEEKTKVAISPGKVFPRLQKLLAYCDTLPDQQALHLDFVRGNLLFRPAQKNDLFAVGDIALSGILDFEKTAFGPPIVDVARTLAFLLVDCKFKTPEKVRKYFLHSGYNKRGGGAAIPLDSPLLEELVMLFLIHDFYKFLRHNPYEFLQANEHFTRTRDMLLFLGVIRYTKDR